MLTKINAHPHSGWFICLGYSALDRAYGPITKKPTAETVGFFNVLLVKVMGIEPMSESISTEASPSAACILRFRL